MSNNEIVDVFLSPKLRKLEMIAPFVSVGTPRNVAEEVEIYHNSRRRDLTTAEISRLYSSKNISIYNVYANTMAMFNLKSLELCQREDGVLRVAQENQMAGGLSQSVSRT